MTDVKIDTTTGLPGLPEGYFWRINGYSVQIMREVETGTWSDWYRIPENFTAGLRTAEDAANQGRRAYKEGAYEFQGRVVKPGFFGGLAFEYRKRRNAHSNDVFTHYYSGSDVMGSWGYEFEEEGRNTKSNILRRVTACYTEWIETQREDAEVAELIGDYPPKKLGDA